MLRKRIDKFLGSELRKQAEEILNKLAEDNNISLPSELKRLLHELQVYRLELEMQNEELNTAQNELEISRNRLADLYDHAPIGYFTLSPIAEILMLNVTGAQMLGHKRQDLLERNLSTYINKTDKDAFNLFIRHVFESTRKQTIELKFINQKKASFYAQLEAVVVESADNNIKQCRVVMLDITERKVAEAQLKEREESLREAQEMANIGSWALNIETNKITVSPQIYHLLGMRRTAQISGEMLLNFIHPDDKDRLLKLYTKIRQDAKPFSMEYRIRLQNGKERWVYSKNKALTDQFGRVIKLSGFIQDITEQKEATALQIQAEKLETASNFARTIAHEVRNPLTTVNLSLAMLRSEAVKLADSKLSNYISTIERNVKRVDQLITQLLYSSRPNESIFTKVHICKIIEDALAEANDRIALSGFEIKKNYLANCPLLLDSESVKIAFLSLIINAIEASPARQGKITITTVQRAKACFITISDNGQGIKPGHEKRIFEPFYSTKTDGMGLGLSNTQNIIESNHGKISVESEPGIGTSFIIQFPV